MCTVALTFIEHCLFVMRIININFGYFKLCFRDLGVARTALCPSQCYLCNSNFKLVKRYPG